MKDLFKAFSASLIQVNKKLIGHKNNGKLGLPVKLELHELLQGFRKLGDEIIKKSRLEKTPEIFENYLKLIGENIEYVNDKFYPVYLEKWPGKYGPALQSKQPEKEIERIELIAKDFAIYFYLLLDKMEQQLNKKLDGIKQVRENIEGKTKTIPGPTHEILKWTGHKNQLYDVLRQLKDKKKIENSFESLAKFLIQSVTGFENTKKGTIETELKRNKRPQKSHRINLDLREAE